MTLLNKSGLPNAQRQDLAQVVHDAGVPATPGIRSMDQLLQELQMHQIELEQQNQELRDTNLALEISRNHFTEFYDQAPVGYLSLTDNGEITEINLTGAALMGVARDKALRQPFARFVRPADADLLHLHLRGVLQQGKALDCELALQMADGAVVEVRLDSLRRLSTQACATVRMVVTNITERKKADDKIAELAFFDPLTHLPNRTLLLDRLQQAMTASYRNGTCGALLFIDLDNFKTLNDTLGHDKGDLLLQQVAQRLTACVREGDTVARLGGDEFVVVLGDMKGVTADAAAQTKAIAQTILATIGSVYRLAATDHRSTASIGVTLFSGRATPIEELLKQADLAMYKAKSLGRNTLRFFDPTMQTAVMERAALDDDLRRAVESRQFVVHYQAQVEGGQRVSGCEALVRWMHPRRGMVPPAQFIAHAEESGLIVLLGHWVLETACTQLALWARQPHMAHLTMAVNVSARQFNQPDFATQVVQILAKTGAGPRRLKLELTESLLANSVQDIIEKMTALKALGVGFSLDDFGTGYSSLSHLKRLPLDQLKIDQSFVADILNDHNDAAIATMIIALANSMQLAVIAEGVETAAQRDFLAELGCHAYQGYLHSRPVPISEFEKFMQPG